MKRQYGKIMQRLAALALGVFLILSSVAQAATNTGLGDIAGTSGDLVDSNVFNLTKSSPTLFKRAFLVSDQSVIADGAVLPKGTVIDFLIFVNNEADLDLNDVTIRDVLDPLFTYSASTIRVLNTSTCASATCTTGEELTIYNAVRVETALSDTAGNDAASFGSLTVEVGNSVATTNAQQNALKNAVLAVVFTVTVT